MAYPLFVSSAAHGFAFVSRRKNNRVASENALARLRDLLELKEFNQDADEVNFSCLSSLPFFSSSRLFGLFRSGTIAV